MSKTSKKETPRQKIYRIKRAFRILKDWQIKYNDNVPYQGQCVINSDAQAATIYAWNTKIYAPEAIPKDYIFHEILHICQAELCKRHPTYQIAREKEEMYIQDLCKFIRKKRKL